MSHIARIGIISSKPSIPLTDVDRVGLWLEGGMINNAGVVTEWEEDSGNGKDWQGVTTNEPTYENVDGLVGDGADEMIMSPTISLATPFTIYIEMKLDAYDCEILGGAASRYGLLFTSTTIHSRVAGAPFATNKTPLPITGNFVVLAFQYEGGTTPCKLYVDGALHGSFDNANMGSPFALDSLFGEGSPYLFRGNIRKLALFQHSGAVHTAQEVSDNTVIFRNLDSLGAVPEDDYELVHLNEDTEFTAMGGNALVSYGGALWNLGGWFGGTDSHSEVWKSTNGGVNWVQQADANWHKRHTFGSGVKGGLIWVWGGDLYFDGNAPKDVWTFNGTMWSQVTSNWGVVAGARVLFAHTNTSTHIYMAGGQTDYGATPTMFTDVVRSTDGITWEKVCDLPISNFSTGSMVVKDNKIFIMSGGRYTSGGHDNYNSKVCSYDLAQGLMGSWVELVTVTPMIGMYTSATVWDGYIWHLMGYHAERGGNQSAIRFSADGINWKMLVTDLPARHASGFAVHSNELYIVAGNLHDDSYKISKT